MVVPASRDHPLACPDANIDVRTPLSRSEMSRPERATRAGDVVPERARRASDNGLGESGFEELRRITVPVSVEMVNLLGPRDEFLRILERDLSAGVHVRGNEITLSGAPAAVDLGVDVITELVTVLRTGQGLTADAVERTVSMLTERSGRDEASPADVLTHNILSTRGKTIRPKTLNQKRYVDAIDKHTVVFGIG